MPVRQRPISNSCIQGKKARETLPFFVRGMVLISVSCSSSRLLLSELDMVNFIERNVVSQDTLYALLQA